MKQRTIVVAGGSSGIGLAVAQQAYAEGWRVIIVDRQEPLDQVSARFVPCDLLDAEAAQAALEPIVRDAERIDALVITAGGAMNGPFAGRDAEVLVEEFANDTLTVLRAARHLLPGLQAAAQEHGVSDIVVLSSLAASIAFDEAVIYGSAAAARHALGEQLRVELRHDHVRARSIATGFVQTPLTEKRRLPDVTEHTTLAPLRSEDVSAVVLHTLNLPKDINVHDMVVVPTYQGWA